MFNTGAPALDSFVPGGHMSGKNIAATLICLFFLTVCVAGPSSAGTLSVWNPASYFSSTFFPVTPLPVGSSDLQMQIGPEPISTGAGILQAAAVATTPVSDRDNSTPTAWQIHQHQTLLDVLNMAHNSNLRVVDLSLENTTYPYQLTATYVSNTGDYAKSWWLLADATVTDISNFISANNARIVVLKG